MRNVTAPDPSRWTSSASRVVPITMRVGFVPTVFKIRSMIGSSMPASVMMPKNRMAKTNMPTTGARLWMPETMNLLVSQPNPPISDAAMGMRMSAISGDIHFIMITVSSRAMVTRPRSASIRASLSRFSLCLCEAAWEASCGERRDKTIEFI